MGAQTPQWLANSIVEAFQDAGATAPLAQLQEEASYLIGQWDKPGRIVHTGRYLAAMFERLDDFTGVTATPAVIKLAACYQGAGADLIWETLGASAKRYTTDLHPAERLTALGIDSKTAERVQTLVHQLNFGHIDRDSMDAQILFDANLAFLATSPQNYTKIRKQLREECASIDDPVFLRSRRKFILELLARPRIFLTPFAAGLAPALRDNLEGELSRIDSLLSISEESKGLGSSHGPRSGAIVIRSSRQQKQLNITPNRVPIIQAPTKPSDSVRIPRPKIPLHEIDDTSTLESVDDPFTKRRI